MTSPNLKPKQNLAYLPLEPYQARYTELMSGKDGWTTKALSPQFNLKRIEPAEGSASTVIKSGRVLDSVNRPIWALEQIKQTLLQYPAGKIFLEDFFTPGVEALPYSGNPYQLYSFCWAQSFDRYDFTREMPWMRAYESMMLSFARITFVASPILQDLILTVFPSLTEKEVQFVGLPFNSSEVRKLFDPSMQPDEVDVVYSSRFDKEKNSMFFLDVVESMPDVKFAICTGHPQLQGTDFASVARAKAITSRPSNLTIYENLTKAEYYSILKASKVQFNCSLQDWVSFTLLEALTHGCLPCYPRRRDFVSVFEDASDYLYSPCDSIDAMDLIKELLASERKAHAPKLLPILEFHDGTYDRIAKAIQNDV